MKTTFFVLFASIYFFFSATPAHALFGQKRAREEAEQRANKLTDELSSLKTQVAADQRDAQDKIRRLEVALVAVVVVATGGMCFVYTYCRTVVVRSPAHEVVTGFVVIDATNVVRSSQGDPPSLLRLIGLLAELEKQKISYKCFFDANTAYTLEENGRSDEAQAYRALLREFYDVFIEVPGRQRADEYILDYAHNHGTPIISNDRYRDYIEKYPWIENSSGRRVPFKAHSSKVQLVPLGMWANVPTDLDRAFNEYCTVLRATAIG